MKKKKTTLRDIAARVHRNPSSISRQLTKAGISHPAGQIDGKVAEKIMADAMLRDNKTIGNDSTSPAYKYKMLQCKRLIQEIQKSERSVVSMEEHLAVPYRIAEIVRDVLYQMVSQTRLTTLDSNLVRLQEKARDDAFNKINRLLHAEGINEVPASNTPTV